MRTWAMAAGVLVVFSQAALAVSGGQTDDFEGGTTQGWGNVTSNVPGGGPAGPNDNYLQVDSSGSGGSGGRLLTFNASQWAGSFSTIQTIEADFKNDSDGARPMRLGLRQSNSVSTTPGYVSTDSVNVPNDGLWHHVTFSIDSSSLTALNSPAPLATFLASVGEMRFVSAASAALIGDAVTGPIGIDNITAQVPEPSALAAAAAAWFVVRRRRQ
jgi:hypothetical protein